MMLHPVCLISKSTEMTRLITCKGELTIGDVTTRCVGSLVLNKPDLRVNISSKHPDKSKSATMKVQPNELGLYTIIMDSIIVEDKTIASNQQVVVDTGYVCAAGMYVVDNLQNDKPLCS